MSFVTLLPELAHNDRDDEQDKHRNNRYRNNLVGRHPKRDRISTHVNPPSFTYHRNLLPSSHPPQRLHTPVHIPLTLQQRIPRMLYNLSLPMQIRQRTRAH